MREIVKTVGPMIAGMLALVGGTRDAHAVGNGEHDTAGAYPAVAKISLPGRTCTATLITPAWMVTAKHCIDGWKAEPGFDVDECDNNLAAFKTAYLPGAAQITVDFSLNAQTLCTPASPPNVPCTQHTLQISGTATPFVRGPQGLGATEPTASSAPPPAASLAAARGVLSAGDAGMFFVGGTEARPPLRRYDLRTESWSPERALTGVAVRNVLTATYSDHHRSLYVLDRTGSGWATKIRLVRVSLPYGTATVIGQWPRTGLFQSHFLTVSEDGSLLLGASSTAGPGYHLVARITLGGDGASPDLDWAVFGGGALVQPPLMSRDTLARTVSKHGGDRDLVWTPVASIERHHVGFGACC